MKVKVERQIGDNVLSIETGELAKQAAGACIVKYGETVVLVATATGASRPGQNFFPLTCDYRERVAAAGKFPGGFLKREGRPTTKETLTSRLMDRPIRPLFPEGFMDEVQVQASILASDRQNDGDVLAMNAASAALSISSMPFMGPIASIRVGLVDGEIIPFPTQDQLEESDLDLIVSGSKKAVLMVEGFARELSEQVIGDAIVKAQEHIVQIVELQEELIEKVGAEKFVFTPPESDGIYETLLEKYFDVFTTAKCTEGKAARDEAVKALFETVKEEMIPDPEAEDAIELSALAHAWHSLESKVVRDTILSGKRPDGRGPKDIRDIECQVDLLPRVHGSAIFQRGETQALITVALGTGRDEQRVDGLLEEYSQKFMLHYYFPAFSVGECRPNRGPGRREIGHGMLAERSVKPVLPDPDDFPYTIRIISDILESNGSSSMASVCGATLGLMSAGVPISNPVAGISVGLVQEGDKHILLTDILGDEDHFGDMDFKIAGTQNGITGIQLDLKCDGLSEEIIRETLIQSRDARINILRQMLTTINCPRAEISDNAPRLLRTHIDPEKIGLLIGPGGKMIRSIQETTGASLDVEDDGTVTIACTSAEGAKKALGLVDALTASVEIGRIYDGVVTNVKDFGAFIEILPGKDGLCHISELSDGYVSSVSDVCKVGDEMQVKVIAVDDQDRVKLSRRAVEQEQAAAAAAADGGEAGNDEGA